MFNSSVTDIGGTRQLNENVIIHVNGKKDFACLVGFGVFCLVGCFFPELMKDSVHSTSEEIWGFVFFFFSFFFKKFLC